MKLQGWGKRKIFLMWFSLVVITGIGDGLGYLLAESLKPSLLIFAESFAAGAMQTMISTAMIPEAVHIGNANIVGLSTFAGFLAAVSLICLKTIYRSVLIDLKQISVTILLVILNRSLR